MSRSRFLELLMQTTPPHVPFAYAGMPQLPEPQKELWTIHNMMLSRIHQLEEQIEQRETPTIARHKIMAQRKEIDRLNALLQEALVWIEDADQRIDDEWGSPGLGYTPDPIIAKLRGEG